MSRIPALLLSLCAATVAWTCDDHPKGVASVTSAALSAAQACADEKPPVVVVSPEPASVNTTPAVNEPLADPSLSLVNPTTSGVRQLRLFAEWLVPHGEPTDADNRQLATALQAFVANHEPAVLEQYLASHESSPWAGSVALNLGIIQRREGRFTKALMSWRFAWDHLRTAQGSEELTAVADRAAGELAQLYVWIGARDQLRGLLTQAKGRPAIGPGAQRLEAARMSLGFMDTDPAITFTCGPFGVDTLCRLNRVEGDFHTQIHGCKATTGGTNLLTLTGLSARVGLKYRAAKRESGAPIPLPALVHWKLNHYSVLAKEEDDRYLIVDQTFDPYQGRELWVSKAALEEEVSGYFLIPAGGSLPSGWSPVDDETLATIWGKSAPPAMNPDDGGCGASSEGGDSGGGGGGGGEDGDGGFCAGMPVYGFHPSSIALALADMPVGYRPVRGPAVQFILRYNSRESHLPATFPFANLGPGWNHNWLSYVVDDPVNVPVVNANRTTTVERYPRGGGYERYSTNITTIAGTPNVTRSVTPSAPFYRNQNIMERLDNTTYRITTTDLMTYTYGRSDGAGTYPRRIYLTAVVDRFGNSVSLSYDAQNRLSGITDALGRVTTFTYGNPDPLKITKVTDPFGRFATFSYTGGLLTGITDVVGLASSFAHAPASDFISTLTTPYGATTFVRGESSPNPNHMKWIESTDPAGDKERIEFAYHGVTSELPGTDPVVDLPTGMMVSNYIKVGVTYFWDKKAMRLVPGDRTKCKATSWAHYGGNILTDTREFVKMPYENRVWFNYPGTTSSNYINGITHNAPSAIGRVIDDGTTQLYKTSYTGRGMVAETTDPLGRKMGYTYDNSGVNLTEVRMTTAGATDLLMKATYTPQRLPETVTDANGRVTSYLYNGFGQVLSMTLPQRAGQPVEKMQYTYNAQGYLTKVTDPLNGTTDFTYDGYDRIRTVKDRDTYTLTYDYDNLDRLTRVTFPDGTYTQTSYSRLDAEWVRDREGRWTRMWYDHLRKVVASRDSAGRVTGLSWCRCGALASLLDPMGRLTVWNYDLQARLTSKVYPDGTAITYAYQPKSGRLASQTDAMGQTTQFEYFQDNKMKQTSYLNAQVATPSVSFTYDNSYGRLASMTDGTGLTNYFYASVPLNTPVPAITGAGQLTSIDGALTNDTITFAYDEWSRTVGSAIGGVGSSAQIDAIGRVKQLTNPLGTFQYAYVGATNRLDNVVAPNGMKTIMAYQALANDFRLSSIRHQTGAAARISEFGYQYSPAGRIQQWTQQADNATATVWSYGYDAVDQLNSARATSGTAGGALIKEYAWQYDGLGNRQSERLSTTSTNAIGKSTYNNLNQLMSTGGGGRMQVKGQIDEPGTVTVNGAAVPVNSDKTFVAEVDTQTGQNTFEVKATDQKGNVRTNQFRIDTTANGIARTLAYDLNGNCTQDGSSTYVWDAQNRLVVVNQGTKRSEFTYDGAGRRVRIVEKDGAAVLSDHRFVWLGATIAERRNAADDVVQIRFLGVGEMEGTTKRYYARDHLGSVREVVDQGGGVLVRYEYSAFGERLRVGGSAATYECAFGYTGHVHHAPTGMALTWFRAYDPKTGRWLSRDPIEEQGGINLYAYVENNPIQLVDPLGLCNNGPVKKLLPAREIGGGAIGGGGGGGSGGTNRSGWHAAPPPNPLKPTSPNQMQKQVQAKKTPSTVDRVDPPHPGHGTNSPHVHFGNGRVLNMDGTWSHVGRMGTNVWRVNADEASWLLRNGWKVPCQP